MQIGLYSLMTKEAVIYATASRPSCTNTTRQAMVFALQQVCSSLVLTVGYMLSNRTTIEHAY